MIAFTDSPGFDDGVANDAEVLSRIAAYINAIHKLKQLVAGVLYLHDITREKMEGVSVRRGFMKNFTHKNHCWSLRYRSAEKCALQRLGFCSKPGRYSTFCGVTCSLALGRNLISLHIIRYYLPTKRSKRIKRTFTL